MKRQRHVFNVFVFKPIKWGSASVVVLSHVSNRLLKNPLPCSDASLPKRLLLEELEGGLPQAPTFREGAFSEVTAPTQASSFATRVWPIGPPRFILCSWLMQTTLESWPRRYARLSARSGKARGALSRAP